MLEIQEKGDPYSLLELVKTDTANMEIIVEFSKKAKKLASQSWMYTQKTLSPSQGSLHTHVHHKARKLNWLRYPCTDQWKIKLWHILEVILSKHMQEYVQNRKIRRGP